MLHVRRTQKHTELTVLTTRIQRVVPIDRWSSASGASIGFVTRPVTRRFRDPALQYSRPNTGAHIYQPVHGNAEKYGLADVAQWHSATYRVTGDLFRVHP